MTHITGKGMYLWIISRIEGGDPQKIADMAVDAGLTHVLVKVADGKDKYNIHQGVDLVPPTVAALKAAGVDVWVWQYTYGTNPPLEAQVGAARVAETQPVGFVVNAEKEYKGYPARAKAYMFELKKHVSVPIYLSTYRYPKLHPEFPWAEFGQYMDGYMPQVYWVGSSNPAYQLNKCLTQYAGLPYPGKPIIPTGCAYPQGDWSPTPEQEIEFLTAARDTHGLTGANFWEWKYAAYTVPSLWQTISAFDWGAPEPPPPFEPFSVVTTSACNLRRTPWGIIVGSLVTGMKLIATGVAQDKDGKDWYYCGPNACFASWLCLRT